MQERIRYRKDFQNAGCQQWLLPNPWKRRGKRHNGFQTASGFTSRQPHPLRFNRHPRHISECSGCGPIERQAKNLFDLIRWLRCRFNSAEAHLQHVAKTIRILKCPHGFFNLSKCQIFHKTVAYFDDMVEHGQAKIKSCPDRSSEKALSPGNKPENTLSLDCTTFIVASFTTSCILRFRLVRCYEKEPKNFW